MAIPVATLVLFITIMLSGNYLKQPLGTEDNVPEAIEGIIKNVMQDNWGEVETETENLEAAWKKVVGRSNLAWNGMKSTTLLLIWLACRVLFWQGINPAH